MSARMVAAREIIGKRIVAFDPGMWVAPGRGAVHNPHITLDDGSVLYFDVEETDASGYGIRIGRIKSSRKRS